MASDFSDVSKIITINDYNYAILRECGERSDVEVWKEVRIKRDFGSMLL
jgi:hypothetical protein